MHFNFITLSMRLVFGALVIAHHSIVFSGGSDFLAPYGLSTGEIGVAGFFFLSGLLLASKALTNSAFEFWVRRLLRVFPGVMAGIFLAVALGLASAALAHKPIRAFDFISFVYTNASIVNPNRQYVVEGAFSSNVEAGVLNGSLWSITFEFWAYAALSIVVALAGRSKLFLRVFSIAIVSVLLWRAIASGSSDTVQIGGFITHLLPIFFAGVIVGTASSKAQRHLLAASLLLIGIGATFFELMQGLPIFTFARTGWIVLALLLLGLSQLRVGRKLAVDPSLGLYVFSYPIGQFISFIFSDELTWWALFAATLAITLPLAVLSFKKLEMPMLALSEKLVK